MNNALRPGPLCLSLTLVVAGCGASPSPRGPERATTVPQRKGVPARVGTSVVPARVAPEPLPAPSHSERLAPLFGATVLETQDGQVVPLYDLMRGKIVLLNFIFTSCGNLCPLATSNLTRVRRLLGDRVGRDIVFLSISIDPETDRPAALKRFAEKFKVTPGWYFLTGKRSDIDQLRRRLGVYDRDAAKDADKFEHTGLLTYGNEPAGRWGAMAVLAEPRDIADAVVRFGELPSLP